MNPGQIQPSGNIQDNDGSIAERSNQLVSEASHAVKDATHKVKEKMSTQYHQVKDYLSSTDLETSLHDAKVFAGKHPIATAIFGLGLGVFVGKMMKR